MKNICLRQPFLRKSYSVSADYLTGLFYHMVNAFICTARIVFFVRKKIQNSDKNVI